MTKTKLRPADIVRRRFEEHMTMTELAKLLGVYPSTLTRWWSDTPHTGAAGGGITHGIIPAKYHVRLLRLAKRHGIKLNADELILGARA